VLPLALAMSCSLGQVGHHRVGADPPAHGGPRSPDPDLGFIELAVSEDAHPPVANSRAATAARIGVDLLIIAPQVRRPRRRAPSTGGFSGIVESQIRLDRGARGRGVRP